MTDGRSWNEDTWIMCCVSGLVASDRSAPGGICLPTPMTYNSTFSLLSAFLASLMAFWRSTTFSSKTNTATRLHVPLSRAPLLTLKLVFRMYFNTDAVWDSVGVVMWSRCSMTSFLLMVPFSCISGRPEHCLGTRPMRTLSSPMSISDVTSRINSSTLFESSAFRTPDIPKTTSARTPDPQAENNKDRFVSDHEMVFSIFSKNTIYTFMNQLYVIENYTIHILIYSFNSTIL